MLINIFGGLGTGKTLLGVILLKKSYDKGKNVFSNINVKFAQKISLEDFLTFNFPDNTVILLDEVYSLTESRLSTSNANIVLSHIFFQSRKKGLDIITTAQLKRSIDVRLRDLADVEILAIREKKDFRYIIFFNDDIIQPKAFTLKYSIAKRYFQYYDTREIVHDEIMKSKIDKLLKTLKGKKV